MAKLAAEKPFSQAVKERRATPSFEDVPIHTADLEKIIRAGLEAPSGYNTQPWRFVVVRDREQKEKLRAAAKENGWNLNMGGIALMWRGGCIIRSQFLGKIKDAYKKNPKLENLLLNKYFSKLLNKYHPSWRKAVINGIKIGVPTPAFSTALAFFDGYRSAHLPANLLQAQRDYFGAHTYERVDQPRGQFFHTNWTGHGGRVSSSTYSV